MSKPIKLFSLLLSVYLALIIILFLGAALAASDFASEFLYENKHNRIEQAAASTVKIASQTDISDVPSMARLQDVIDAAGDVAGARIYLIEADRLSSVVSYKGNNDRGIDTWILNDAKKLLDGKEVYRSDIFSDKFNERISFVGMPVVKDNKIAAVVLVFSPLADVEDALNVVMLFIWGMAVVACVIGGLVILFVSRKIVRPLKELKMSAEAMAEGNYVDDIIQHNGTEETILLTKSFNMMKNQVQEAEDKRRQLIADVSHELRTPLMTIRGFVMAVLDGTAEGEQADKSLRRAYSETQRMGRLTEGLLHLARLQAGSELCTPEVLVVADMISDIAEAFAFELQSKQLAIAISCKPEIEVFADADQFVRIMTNLLSNAVNYSDKPGMISISVHCEGNEAVICVSDQGVGIAAAELSMIFEKFHRVDKSRSQQTPGTGLGLSIVQELVRLNSGSIEVDSELGKGSCFTCRLPMPLVRNDAL